MTDISVVMFIEMTEDKAQEISWILNEACTKIEGLKCQVFYKMKDDKGREIHKGD
jgi:hypothetical protein